MRSQRQFSNCRCGAGRGQEIGQDEIGLRGKPILNSALRARREAVETLLPPNHGPLLLARRLSSNGFDAFKAAQAKGWEGIIAKDESSPEAGCPDCVR
jgi:ATP-dependent DNA ligase